MFETLTCYISQIDTEKAGNWGPDHVTGKNGKDEPVMPFVIYSSGIKKLVEAVGTFAREHPECKSYDDILAQSNIEWGEDSMGKADVSKLDGKTVFALILGACRAERFCDGALLYFAESGCLSRWLHRLKEIDEQNKESEDRVHDKV